MNLKFGTSGVRGLNSDFTPEATSAFVKSFLDHYNHHPKSHQYGSGVVALAGDLRESTPGIIAQIKQAMLSYGYEILDCGLLPTPALAYFCSRKGIPGIMVSGSHIPADRNGLKFYFPWGEILKEDEQKILERFSSHYMHPAQVAHPAETLFIDRYVRFFEANKKPLANKTVLVYQHSSVARDILPIIFKNLGATVHTIHRSSLFTPVDTEAVTDGEKFKSWIEEHTKSEGPVFAMVSTDGDSDRPLLVDEKGQVVRGDVLGVLTAQFLKAQTVVTPISSNSLVESSGLFENVILTKIGSPFVIEGMQKAGGDQIVGFEANGGFLTQSDFKKNNQLLKALPTRDSVLPLVAPLIRAAELNVAVSALVDQLPAIYTDSGLFKPCPTDLSAKILSELKNPNNSFFKEMGTPSKTNTLDGYRLYFANNEVVHFRPSGNAPEFRVYSEASSIQRARKLVEESLSWIESQLQPSR